MSKDELTLATPMETLEECILQEQDIDNLNNMIDLFNLNLKKKDILRSKKLQDIQDKVVGQMYDRIDIRGDEFSNSDLIQMHKVVNDTLNKSDTTLENIKVPTIQINQQVNINGEQEFDRESRQRILNAVNSIIANLDNDEIIEVEEEEVEITGDGFSETE